MSRSFQLLGIYWPGIVLVGNLTTAAVLLYGGLRVIDDQMQVGVLAAFVLYLRRFFEPLAEVSQFYDSFQAAAAGLEKLAGVLDEEPGVPYPEQASPRPADGLHGRGRLSRRPLRLPRRDRHPLGLRPAHPGRPDRGPARGDRCGQEHRRPAARPLLRPARGRGVGRRHPAPGPRRVAPAQSRRHGDPGELPVLGHAWPRTSPSALRHASRGRDRRRRPRRRRRLLRRRARGRLRERRRQAGLAGCRPASASSSRSARAILADPAVLVLDEASSSLDAPMERLVQSALKTRPRPADGRHNRPPTLHRRDSRSRPRTRGRAASWRTVRRRAAARRRLGPLRGASSGLAREPRLSAPPGRARPSLYVHQSGTKALRASYLAICGLSR